MAESNSRVESSITNGDVQKAIDLLKRLRKLTRYRAVVVSTVSPGIHKVNIATAGLKEALCYDTWETAGDVYQKDAAITVSVDEFGVAYILPPEIPRGFGKTKVLQIIDDSNPGTAQWDFVRFSQGSLDAFDPNKDPNA